MILPILLLMGLLLGGCNAKQDARKSPEQPALIGKCGTWNDPPECKKQEPNCAPNFINSDGPSKACTVVEVMLPIPLHEEWEECQLMAYGDTSKPMKHRYSCYWDKDRWFPQAWHVVQAFMISDDKPKEQIIDHWAVSFTNGSSSEGDCGWARYDVTYRNISHIKGQPEVLHDPLEVWSGQCGKESDFGITLGVAFPILSVPDGESDAEKRISDLEKRVQELEHPNPSQPICLNPGVSFNQLSTPEEFDLNSHICTKDELRSVEPSSPSTDPELQTKPGPSDDTYIHGSSDAVSIYRGMCGDHECTDKDRAEGAVKSNKVIPPAKIGTPLSAVQLPKLCGASGHEQCIGGGVPKTYSCTSEEGAKLICGEGCKDCKEVITPLPDGSVLTKTPTNQ